MQNVYILIFLALVAGAVLPLQGAANTRLSGGLESPVLASLVSFAIGTAALLIYALLTGTAFGGLSNAKNIPPAAWLGGVFGAFFVVVSVILIPRIGVAATFGLAVAGQMAVTLVVDHFGVLGVEARPISIPRVAGIILITAGVVLVRK